MRRCLRTLLVACVLVAAVPPQAGALQQVRPADRSTAMLRVYLDCDRFRCDQDYVRRELGWVDWVRDRQDADVHVLVATEQTGGGGTMYELTILGRRGFAGAADTLTAGLPAAATDDDERRALVRELGLGLVRYAADTPMGERLRVTVAGDTGSTDDGADGGGAAPADDPWDFWVFSVSGRGFFNGESRRQARNIYGSLSARRTTDEWKLDLGLNGGYNRTDFELTDRVATSIRRDYGGNLLLVKSVGPNWSAGFRISANSASFVNQDLSARAAPAVEYNVFPYDESTRRQLTFRYSAGPSYVDYAEETIYGRMTERLIEQQLALSLSFTQPWGDVSTSVELSHYPTWGPGSDAVPELAADDRMYRAVLSSNVDLELVKGLSLTLSGNYQRIHDQIYLARGGASDDEVLLRIRQLQTGYRYFGSVGLRYTFGSIYNNIVNPRFGGSSGGGFVFMF